MSVRFRPMPILSVIVVIMLVILISLGRWQYKRLKWKTNLLAEVEASVQAPPLRSLEALEIALKSGDPVDFRRVVLTGIIKAEDVSYCVFKSQTGGIFWDVYQPFDSEALGDRPYIFMRTQTITEDEKKDGGCNNINMTGPFFGYIRKDHPMGRVEKRVKAQPDRPNNSWFKFNQDGSWGERYGSKIIMSHYIELASEIKNIGDLEIKRPKIRNNHLNYMLTWFSFAFLLIIFYVLIHKRAGRLSW